MSKFLKEVCPACKKLITRVFDTEQYICHDSNHFYDVKGDHYSLVFKNFSINGQTFYKTLFLRDQYGYFISFGSDHKKITIDLETICNLPGPDEIVNYFNNLLIMS